MRRPTVIGEARSLDLPMTPMIDVVFQLIIFFLCTTRFTPLEHVLPTLIEPTGETLAQTPPPELQDLTEVVVKLAGDRSAVAIDVNGRKVDGFAELRTLLQAVANIRADTPVIIDPASTVAMQEVITAYDICRQVGFVRVQFAAPDQP